MGRTENPKKLKNPKENQENPKSKLENQKPFQKTYKTKKSVLETGKQDSKLENWL
jgi:hypothetical protein